MTDCPHLEESGPVYRPTLAAMVGDNEALDVVGERCYTGGVETNVTGAFCFSNAIKNTIFIVGKAPHISGLPSRHSSRQRWQLVWGAFSCPLGDDVTSKYFEENPLTFSPTLATYVGLNEAIFLQQLNYWSKKDTVGKKIDGYKWIRNTLEEWRRNFPFWDIRTLKGAIQNVRNDSLVLARSDLNEWRKDRTLWYSINYHAVEMLQEPVYRLTTKGYIYLFRRPADSAYKIGLSRQPQARLEQIRKEFPCAELIHLIKTDNMQTLESELHSLFADYRLDGEWFSLSSEGVDYIRQL